MKKPRRTVAGESGEAADKMHPKQRLKREGKGKWLFTIPEVPEQVVVPRILSRRGEAAPIEPPEIVESSPLENSRLHLVNAKGDKISPAVSSWRDRRSGKP